MYINSPGNFKSFVLEKRKHLFSRGKRCKKHICGFKFVLD